MVLIFFWCMVMIKAYKEEIHACFRKCATSHEAQCGTAIEKLSGGRLRFPSHEKCFSFIGRAWSEGKA